MLMVFNATFNNISVISRQSVILVEETGVPRETPQCVLSAGFVVKISIGITTNFD